MTKKLEIRWLCACFVVRESAAEAVSTSCCSSSHEKEAVDIISSKPGGMGAFQSKRGTFLWRFLKRITKRKSWPVNNLLKDPEDDGPAPRADSTSKSHLMMEVTGSAKTTLFHSINLKPEVLSLNPGISSSYEKQRHMMMMSIPPAFKRRHLNPRIRSSSVFAWTGGPRRMEDFVVMDGTLLGN
jgi:hypothetical protein